MNATAQKEHLEPYKGLRPYEEKDRENFFGRDADCKILIDKILANKLTLLFAASGVGKSSLLRAAVLPQLKDPKHENLDAVYYNDWVSPPLAGLKQAVLDTLQDQGKLDTGSLVEDLNELTLKDFLAFCALFTRQPLVVVLDQFEEFFQYQRYTADFKPFVQQLSTVVTDSDTPVALVISMREDFALELNAFKPTLPTLLFENFYRLERFDKINARKAIETPVDRIGFRYEPELLKALLDDLAAREQGGPVANPIADYRDTVEPAYLQIVCSQLWELDRSNANKTLRLKTYQDRGDAAGLLKSYVENTIERFSAAEKKLASKTFNHLITRRGTKMAYTAADLAQLLGVDAQALGKVLDRLEQSRILRRQSRQGVLWYELYHDLFSNPIEQWNEVYKARQRNKKALILAGLFIMTGLALYGAYDIVVNYTNYHLRLSVKEDISDNIELYRGKAGSQDILGLQSYIAETGYQRTQVEPDKLFKERSVGDYDELNSELIGYLPLVKRIESYWEDGQISEALDLAEKSIKEDDVQRSQAVIKELTSFRSLSIVDLLIRSFQNTRNEYFKESIVTALSFVNSPKVTETLLAALEDPYPKVRDRAVLVLGLLGSVQAVEPLINHLNDPDSDVRQSAVYALGQLGSAQAVEPLINHLNDPKADVRMAAADALGQLGSVQAVEPLVNCLNDPIYDVRREAADALGQLGGAHQAVEPLINRLNDPDSKVRQNAVEALVRLGSVQAVEPLINHLNDPDSNVRDDAADALGQLGSVQAVEPLINRLNDPHPYVRRSAAWALGDLGSVQAVEPLINRLNDPDVWVRGGAANALGRLGSAQAVEPLINRLNDPHPYVREEAADALGQLDSVQAVEPLINRLNDPDSKVRQNAADALGQLGSAQAVEPLINCLNDPDSDVRRKAAEALVRLGSVQAVEPLINRLNDPNSDVREGAARVLGQLGSAQAVEPLINRLNDPYFPVRGVAAWALVQLGSAQPVELLISYLNDPDSDVRGGVAWVLGQLDSAQAVEPLINRLSDSNSDVRQNAADALGRLGSAQAVEPLINHLNDPDSDVRGGAADALGRLGIVQAIEPLINRLNDPDSDVRQNAAKALGQLGSAQAINPLLKKLRDSNEDVRREIVLSLGKIGDIRTLDGIAALLGDQTKQSHRVKIAAAATLLALRQQEVIPTLSAFARSERINDRKELAEALGEVPTEPGNQLLLGLLEDKNFNVTIQAIESLGKAKAKGALPHLHQRLANPNIRIQEAAANALAGIASPESIPPLREVVLNPQTAIPTRLAALSALGSIGTDAAIKAILEAVAQDNMGILTIRAYKILGRLKTRLALTPLSNRLIQLEKQYREWRSIRDSEREDFTKEEADAWAKKLEAARPEPYLAFELAYAMARIDPENTGLQLLSHDLANVRYGAWMGFGEVGSFSLLKRLHQERQQSENPLFRHAAYRAVDNVLIHLEAYGNPKDLEALEAFYPTAKDEEGIGTRVEWTIERLKKPNS